MKEKKKKLDADDSLAGVGRYHPLCIIISRNQDFVESCIMCVRVIIGTSTDKKRVYIRIRARFRRL